MKIDIQATKGNKQEEEENRCLALRVIVVVGATARRVKSQVERVVGVDSGREKGEPTACVRA